MGLGWVGVGVVGCLVLVWGEWGWVDIRWMGWVGVVGWVVVGWGEVVGWVVVGWGWGWGW